MNALTVDSGLEAKGGSRYRLRSPVTLRELITPVFYYKRVAILAFVIPVLIALLAVMAARPIYTAQSRLLILLGDDYVFHSDVGGGNTSQSFDRPQIVNAEMEILGSEDLRADTLKKVGLDKVYPKLANGPHAMEQATEQFGKDLKIDNVPQSNVIQLSLRNRSAQVASDALNILVQTYIEKRRAIFQQSDIGSVNAQRDALSQRLADVERQLTGMATDNGFGDYPSELTAVQDRRASLTSQIQSMDQDVAARTGRSSTLRNRLNGTTPVVELSSDQGRPQRVQALTQSLVDLQNQRREAANRFVEGYPLLTDLDHRIAAVQAQIDAAPPAETTTVRHGANPVRQEIDTQLVTAESDAAGLRLSRAQAAKNLEGVDQRLALLVRIGPQYRELQRQRTLLEQAYSEMAQKSEQDSVSASLARSQANVRVVQSADPPVKGHSGRAVLLAAGIGLGVIFAATLVVLSAAMSGVMVTPGDVERKLETPILLAVPFSEGRSGKAAPRFLNPDDANLISQLMASVAPDKSRVMQMITANGGEGSSSLILDLALLLAHQVERRILLIDVKPAPGKGASDALAARGAKLEPIADGKVFRMAGSQLFVTPPVGSRTEDSRWESILSTARKQYDIVLIDTPNMTRSSVSVILAPLVDMNLIVVEAEKTRSVSARHLIDRIDATGGQVIGAILNKRRFYIPPFVYRWI